MRKIYLLLLSLILLPYIAVAQTDDFNVTGGTSGTDYSYSEGVLTVNTGADITISMANGATEPTSDRIVVNGNAEITLNGVNITGSEYDDINVTNAQSAIDVSESATLILNLSESSQNTLTGGSGGNSVGAPGIHVPASSSLVIQGSGGLSVKGGNSTNTYGGNGIGGKSGSGQTGTACGTVVILATGNVTVTGGDGLGSTSDGVDIGGGSGTQKGDDGQGIRHGTDGTYTVYGNLELPEGVTFPENITLNIPSGTSLTLPDNFTWPDNIQLTGEGSISDTGKLTATISITEDINLDKTYDGKAVSFDNNYTYNSNGEPVITWHADNNGTIGAQLSEAPSDAGSYWIKVAVAATNFYTAAEDTKQFTISKAKATITLTLPQDAVYDGTSKEATAAVVGVDGETATLTAEISYYSDEEMTQEVSAPTDAGTYYVKATFAGNDNYNAAEDATGNFSIAKAAPQYTEPTGLTATYGQTLADVELPEGWTWNNAEQSVGEVGEHQFTAIFTPDDLDNYNVVNDIEVTITVNQADISEQIKAESDTNISLDLETESLTLTAYVEGEGISDNGKWIWESDDESVAIVEEMPETRSAVPQSSRKVILVGEGTATITATYSDGTNYSGSVDFTITVTAKEEEPAPDPKPDPQPQPDPTPLYYSIQFENICEGVDASLSKGVVKEGNQVSVYIEVEEGYDGENLKVLFKRSLYGYWEEVEEGVQPGEYIIYNVYDDIYVKVEGVEKIEEEPTGMSDIEGTKVYTQNGSLYVYTSQPQEVMIITMNGTILKRERQEGLRSYSLPKGVYIICIGDERMKVRN